MSTRPARGCDCCAVPRLFETAYLHISLSHLTLTPVRANSKTTRDVASVSIHPSTAILALLHAVPVVWLPIA